MANTSQPNPHKTTSNLIPNLGGLLTNAFIMAIEPIGRKGRNRDPKVVNLPYIPDEISIPRSAEYKKTPIPFGTENTLFYERTSPIAFNLAWTYVAGVNIMDGLFLMQTTQLLHSMVCPGVKTREAGRFFGEAEYERPGVVWVVIGTWLRLRCVIEDIKLTYHGPWGSAKVGEDPGEMLNFDTSGLMPRECDCSVSFESTQFYDAHKGTSIPGTVQSLPEAAKKLGAKSLRNREFIRDHGLSNITFASMVKGSR